MADDRVQRVAAKLKAIRERTDLKLKPTPHLKQTFTGFDGIEHELKIRYYQVQGILHLIFMKRFLLGDDTGLGKCVTGDTLLWTDQGLIPISALAPQPLDQLAPGTFYEPTFPVKVWTGSKWAAVKRFYYEGLRATKKVATRTGLAVEGSHRHPLKVRGAKGEGWRRLPDVQVGEYLLVDRQAPEWPEDPRITFRQTFATNAKWYTLPSRMSPHFARLLGYIVAEGHSPNQYRVTVTQHDPEAHADIRDLFERVFGWAGNEDNAKQDIAIEVTSVQIRSFLETCGIGPALSADKRVPPLVMRSSRESVVEFLRGFFEGEGHAIEGSGVEVSSASERLLREVHLLLLRLGVVSVLKPKKVKGRDHTYWRLTIFGEDARLFAQRVGFVTRRKQDALNLVLEKVNNPNLDVVPHAREMVESLRTEIYARCGRHEHKGGGISKRWGSAFYNTLEHVRAERRNPTYDFLNQMLRVGAEVGVPENHPAMCAVRAVCSQHAFYDPVVSVEDGYAEVMDIEVDDPDHCFVGNGLINHNTLQSIAALCYIWEKDPSRKAIVLTTKSATPQWAKEFGKFTKGVRVIVAMGDRKKRYAAYEAWRKSSKPTVMVLGYRSAVNDIRKLQEDGGYILITDEATAYKNPKTQVHQVVRHMSNMADRTWALTATLIKNHLMEGHGIYSVVVPGLLPTTNAFMYYYCIVEMMQIGRGRKVPRIVGYYPEKVVEFREVISPYYLGRPKHDVASELPALTREVYEVGLSPAQETKYLEAMEGMLYVGEKRDEGEEEKEVTKLTALIYHQQIVNHPDLIECEGSSEKLDALIDLLTNGDLAGEKVIVFSRFKKMVNLLMPALRKAKLNPVRVTGDESGEQRQAAQDRFQDPNSDTQVICITMAGGDAINLQAAKAIVFYDTPWSAGDYIQIIGRMIRIGSQHDNVLALHLVAKSKNPKIKGTIDEKVMQVIDKKMRLIEAVLGERLKGTAKDEAATIDVTSEINEIFDALKADTE
jgi:intein/homing endonuclease